MHLLSMLVIFVTIWAILANQDFHLETSFEVAETMMTSSDFPEVHGENVPASTFHISPHQDPGHLRTRTPYEKHSIGEQDQENVGQLLHVMHQGNRDSEWFPTPTWSILNSVLCKVYDLAGTVLCTITTYGRCPNSLACRKNILGQTDSSMAGVTFLSKQQVLISPTKVAEITFVSVTKFQ